MKSLFKRILQALNHPHLIEFDYQDGTGTHHGRCYVNHLFGGEKQVQRVLNSFGYTNVHIV